MDELWPLFFFPEGHLSTLHTQMRSSIPDMIRQTAQKKSGQQVKPTARMTVNWLEGSVTVIHFPWADLGRPPQPPPSWDHSALELSLVHFLPQVQPVDIGAGETKNNYTASDLIIASSLLFILRRYTIKTVTREKMKCQSELQACAEVGHKSSGRAKRSSLLIVHILATARGILSLCNRLAY